MTKKLLVTGLSGFVGTNLSKYISNQPNPSWSIIDTPEYDLNKPESLSTLFSDQTPDAVIHLAAQSFVPESFKNPKATINTNLIGTLNLLQALKTADFRGAFLYVSSGDVYGLVEESDLPISECLQPQPRNPYAVSKVAAELLCQQWSYSEPDWRIMIARPFNHIGPGQNDSFLVPEIAKQLCLIKAGQQSPELQLGDIDVTRDFTDVRDVISAYFTILESGKSGEIYNICSGKERLVRDIILTMCELAKVDAQITQDESRLRKSQQRRAVGDYGKLASNTGWQPTIELEESLRAILSDWEQRIHS